MEHLNPLSAPQFSAMAGPAVVWRIKTISLYECTKVLFCIISHFHKIWVGPLSQNWTICTW